MVMMIMQLLLGSSCIFMTGLQGLGLHRVEESHMGSNIFV